MKRLLILLFLLYIIGLSGLASATQQADNSTQQVQKLKAQVANLTKENRELKAQLANQTKQINQLRAENDFLKQQIEEYRALLAKVMEQESERATKSYIEQARTKEKIGKVLLGALATGAIFAGLVVWLGKRAEARYKRLV